MKLKALLEHIHDNVMTAEERSDVAKIISETGWVLKESPAGNAVSVAPVRLRPERQKETSPELDFAYIFADMGYEVFLTEEKGGFKQKSYDAIINGVPVEFKRITGNADTAAKKFRKALRQARSVAVWIAKEMLSEEEEKEYIDALEQAGKKKKEANILVVYFQADGSLKCFDFSKIRDASDIKKAP